MWVTGESVLNTDLKLKGNLEKDNQYLISNQPLPCLPDGRVSMQGLALHWEVLSINMVLMKFLSFAYYIHAQTSKHI